MNQLQTIEPEIAGQRTLFDYAALDQETQVLVLLRAGEIKSLAKRVAGDIVEIGGKLAEVKDRINGAGKFNDWLSAELGWSERTAYNFMAVWQKFGAANFALENVATSALYLLAAPSTPAEAVDVARQIAESGGEVTHGVAKEIVRQAKERKPKQVELIDELEEVEEEPALGPGEAEKKQELPPGWGFDGRVEGFCAITAQRNVRTVVFATREEAIASAHEIEAAKREGLLGLTGRGPASAPKAPATVSSPAAGQRPASWFKTRVEITITLMPGAEPRRIMHSVRAGEGKDDLPFVAVSSGERELLDVLPPITRGLLERAADAFAKKPAKKPDSREQPLKSKNKAAAKKPAAKLTKKGGKK